MDHPHHQPASPPRKGYVRGSASLQLGVFILVSLFWYLPSPPILLTPDAVSVFALAECIHRTLAEDLAEFCYGAAHWQPGQAASLALLAKLHLSTATAARWLGLLSGAMLIPSLFVLGRRLGGREVGLWAAALSLPSAVLRFHALVPEARLTALSLTLGAWASLALYTERRKSRHLFAAFFLASMASFWRPEAKLTLLLVGFVFIADTLYQIHHKGMEYLHRTMLYKHIPAAGAGAAAVFLPFHALAEHILPKEEHFSRTWEMLAGTWIAYIKTPLFASLFGFGDRITPFRTYLRRALDAGEVEIAPHDALDLMIGMIKTNLPNMPEEALRTLGWPLFAAGLTGVGLMLFERHAPRTRWAWFLLILPLAPLALLAQTYNAVLPESNLLFLLPAFFLPTAYVIHKGLSRITHRWARLLGPAFFVVLFLAGRDHYNALVEERKGRLFEGSREARAAGLWLKRHTAINAEIYTTWVGSSTAYHGERKSLPWPSSWEIPALVRQLESEKAAHPPRYLVITSVDPFERPLELDAWMRSADALLRWEFYLQGETSHRWIAILSLNVPVSP